MGDCACFTVIAVGSTRASGTASASEVALGTGASGDKAGGLEGVLVPVAVGPEGAGDGAGGALTGDSLHFFGFVGRAFAGGFGVTSARHAERAARRHIRGT